MTVPDPAPTVTDVLAEALVREVWIGFCDEAGDDDAACGVIDADDRHLLAAAVVAAIRDMTAEQQAELIGGSTERLAGYAVSTDLDECPVVRVVGPWRAEP